MAKEKSGGRFGKFLSNKKYRPWLIGGVVIIGAIVLFSLIRPKGSSATSQVSAVPGGPSEQAQLQMASIQAGLTSQAQQAQAAINIAGIEAAAKSAELQTAQNIAQTQSSTALEIERLETEQKMFAIEKTLDTETQLGLANIEAQKFQIAQEAEIAFSKHGSEVAIASQAIAAQTEEREQYYENQRFGLEKAKRKHVGAILAGESPELGTKTKSIMGGIFSLGGLLSDLRVKDDIVWSGVNDGQNRYTYFNEGTGAVEAGVMAQEVDEHFIVPMGVYDGVDYIALTAEGDYQNG